MAPSTRPPKPGRVGRPPTPPERKIDRNDPRQPPRPPADLTALPTTPPDQIPEPLRPLGDVGQDMWDRVWGAGASWISPHAEMQQIQVLCEQLDERETLRRMAILTGDYRQRAALRALEAQIISGLGLIGFNPVERARLNLGDKKPPTLVEEIAERRRQKAG